MIKNIQNLNTKEKRRCIHGKNQKISAQISAQLARRTAGGAFFGASFLLVAVFFDLQFVMTASIMTVLFQIRYARYNSWGIFSVSWSSAKPLLFSP